MIIGLLTLPLTYLVSKAVFLSSYLLALSLLALWSLNSASFLSWLTLLLSLVYLCLTAMLRPEYLEISFRLLTVIFVITSALRVAYVYDSYKLERLIRFTILICLFSALLGIKQFIFGYTDYEVNIASGIGSLVGEFNTLNSSRSMGLTFDPLSQGLLLGISFHGFVFINKFESRRFFNAIYAFAQFLIVVSLLLTLNRTSIIAFILSLSIYLDFGIWGRLFSGISGMLRAIMVFGFMCLIFYILSLPEFDYPKRALLSVFEVFGFDNDTDEFFGRAQSVDKRLSSAGTIVDFVKHTPFGIRSEITGFAVNDVGVLSPIFKFGILGGGIILLLMYIPLVGLVRDFFTKSASIREESISRLIYSCYLVIVVSSLSSFSVDGTIMMLPSWFIICLALRKTMRN